jgi:DNA-binding CsgD family transcriptional regulator
MSVPVPWSHERELVADPLSVSEARGFVAKVLVEHNLALLVGVVELVVSELATNALLHAGSSFTVRLRIALGQAVVLEVQDGSQSSTAVVAAAALATTKVATDGQEGMGHGWASLTDAELRVVCCVARGMTNRTVAGELYLSRHTVDAHLKHIYLKLDIHSRVELTVLAVQHRVHVSCPNSHAAAADSDTGVVSVEQRLPRIP